MDTVRYSPRSGGRSLALPEGRANERPSPALRGGRRPARRAGGARRDRRGPGRRAMAPDDPQPGLERGRPAHPSPPPLSAGPARGLAGQPARARRGRRRPGRKPAGRLVGTADERQVVPDGAARGMLGARPGRGRCTRCGAPGYRSAPPHRPAGRHHPRLELREPWPRTARRRRAGRADGALGRPLALRARGRPRLRRCRGRGRPRHRTGARLLPRRDPAAACRRHGARAHGAARPRLAGEGAGLRRSPHRWPAAGDEGRIMSVVETELSGGVLTVALADEANRNALGERLVGELVDALDDADADPAVRVVVLTNSGTVFCAGANLSERSGSAGGPAAVRSPHELFGRFARSPKPYVGRIAGHCVAGGMGLAAAMDISIAVEDATFGFTEVRIGVAPAVISVVCLPKLRRSDALELFLTGERISAARAAEVGLVTRAVAHDQLDAAVADVVGKVVRGGPQALAVCKQLIARIPEMSR